LKSSAGTFDSPAGLKTQKSNGRAKSVKRLCTPSRSQLGSFKTCSKPSMAQLLAATPFAGQRKTKWRVPHPQQKPQNPTPTPTAGSLSIWQFFSS
jgi:hypothetical protein